MKRDTLYVGIEILVVDGDASVRGGLKDMLEQHGFIVTALADIEDAIELIRTKFYAVVLCDLDNPDTEEGLRVVRAVREHSPATESVVLSSRRGFDVAVAAFRAGATDIVIKQAEELNYLIERVVASAKEFKRHRDRDSLLVEMAEVHEDFLRRMREMYKMVVDIQDRLQGRDVLSTYQLPECRVLIVDDLPDIHQKLEEAFWARDDGWSFALAQSGGEALDVGGREKYHVALVKSSLPDLPGSMVISTLRAQSPETIFLSYSPPGSPGASVEVCEAQRVVPILEQFSEVAQLAGRLDEIRDAFKAKAVERRYLQSFRTAQFDFLKKYAELNQELRRAKRAMSGREPG